MSNPLFKIATVQDKASEIYSKIMGKSRIRKELKTEVFKIINHMIKKQEKFDFNYYLSKNCALPSNWKERKAHFMSEAVRDDPDAKKEAYKEIFDMNSSNFAVGNFLAEFLAHVLPKDFMEHKNKKLFNKKVHQFVAFNKFETFNRISMLDRLKLNEIKWLKF